MAALFQGSCLSRQTPKTQLTPQLPLVETPVEPAPLPPPVEPTKPLPRPEVLWSEVHEKVFKVYCTGCHSTNNTLGISSYEDAETVRNSIGTIYYYVVVASAMPPPPSDLPEGDPNPNQLPRDEKDLLSHWVVDGMK